jgi:hypothetical protein
VETQQPEESAQDTPVTTEPETAVETQQPEESAQDTQTPLSTQE